MATEDMATEGMEGVYYVESINDMRIVEKGKTKQVQYEVKWQGYGSDDNTWEPESNLTNSGVLALIAKYKAAEATKRNRKIRRKSTKRFARCHTKATKAFNRRRQSTKIVPPKKRDYLRQLKPSIVKTTVVKTTTVTTFTADHEWAGTLIKLGQQTKGFRICS